MVCLTPLALNKSRNGDRRRGVGKEKGNEGVGVGWREGVGERKIEHNLGHI